MHALTLAKRNFNIGCVTHPSKNLPPTSQLFIYPSNPAMNSPLPSPAVEPSSSNAIRFSFTADIPQAAPSNPPAGDCWDVKATECQAERVAALRLVHQVYAQAGLTAERPQAMRVMRHHLSDQTQILIAKRGQEVMLTGTLVGDAEYGMPLESLFADEVAAMRSAGLKLGEISCLASDLGLHDKKERFERLVTLISLIFQTARRRGMDRLLLAVHPRHAKIYQRLFGCVPCSDVKQYAAVQGNPAVMCMHDFKQLDACRYPLYHKMYGEQYPPWKLDGGRMTAAEKAYFSSFCLDQASELLSVGA